MINFFLKTTVEEKFSYLGEVQLFNLSTLSLALIVIKVLVEILSCHMVIPKKIVMKASDNP